MSFHEKKYHFNRKGIYLLLLIVITLSGFVLKNTYAKFASENEAVSVKIGHFLDQPSGCSRCIKLVFTKNPPICDTEVLH